MKAWPIGTRVRARDSRSKSVAVIAGHLESIDGGVKLDRPLEGMRLWNCDGLIRVLGRAVKMRRP